MIIHGLNLRSLLSFRCKEPRSCQRDGAVNVNRWQSGSLQLSGPQVFMGILSTLQGNLNQELPLECLSSFYDGINHMISETSSIQQGVESSVTNGWSKLRHGSISVACNRFRTSRL